MHLVTVAAWANTAHALANERKYAKQSKCVECQFEEEKEIHLILIFDK